MQFFTLPSLAIALAALTAARPAPAPVAATDISSYPGTITDTAGQWFQLRLNSFIAGFYVDRRNVQLVPSKGGVTLAGIDPNSPVLTVVLQNGSLLEYDPVYGTALGPVGGLRTISSNSTESNSAFVFRNLTSDAGQSFKASQGGWYLAGGGETATYNLYHNTKIGLVNGFIMCGEDLAYYQFFYFRAESDPESIEGCYFVALETTIAPILSS